MGVGNGAFRCGFWEWAVRTCGNLGLSLESPCYIVDSSNLTTSYCKVHSMRSLLASRKPKEQPTIFEQLTTED